MNFEDVLDFWFGLEPQQWWRVDPDLDAEIARRFGTMLKAARQGDLDGWAHQPQSALALVILLDQMTRNVHRGTSAMYAHDSRARAIAQRALDDGHDQHLPHARRMFLFMPLMHSEELEHQRACLRRFEAWCDEAPAGMDTSGHLRAARAHHDIVERFGRFPHRNAILGRASTAEEEAFLKEPGSSF